MIIYKNISKKRIVISKMLRQVIEQTITFSKNTPKSVRKKKGQFFTSAETAKFMVEMFNFTDCKKNISVLDPGAGTGILSVAFIERTLSLYPNMHISLTCYETDTMVLPILKSNLEYVKSIYPIQIDYKFLVVLLDYSNHLS